MIYVSSICSKARKLLGMLYRRFYTHLNSDALFHLYQLLVRPHLEYASSVWSPYRTGEIKALEDVQKFALRICRKTWDQSYQSLLELFQIPTLEDRRIYLDLCTMFKVVHNLCYFPSDVLCEHHVTRNMHQSHTWQAITPPLSLSKLSHHPNFKNLLSCGQ